MRWFNSGESDWAEQPRQNRTTSHAGRLKNFTDTTWIEGISQHYLTAERQPNLGNTILSATSDLRVHICGCPTLGWFCQGWGFCRLCAAEPLSVTHYADELRTHRHPGILCSARVLTHVPA